MLNIKGVIFDYGGTIDTNGKHWVEVLWDAYAATGVPVSKQQFRDAYAYGERWLSLYPMILPQDNFKSVLLKKISIQLTWLKNERFLPGDCNTLEYSLAISCQCYAFILAVIEDARPVLEELAAAYPLVLVSNFYGNMETVLENFDLRHYFKAIVESAIVGIRKPDPAIFALGVEKLGMKPEEIVVIGDSYKKDIFPAGQIGCKTIWLKGAGWDGDSDDRQAADIIIQDIKELRMLIKQ
ncbi:MAG: HAD family hydrolase [Dysgonamonadaceae bacterium]|nr:HAD family hydrolase [Dysgonamonadaceae bacterium]